MIHSKLNILYLKASLQLIYFFFAYVIMLAMALRERQNIHTKESKFL